jgi:hypothetical protein
MGRDFIDLMSRAISDRTRLRILHLLQGGESCVGDIVESAAAPAAEGIEAPGLLAEGGACRRAEGRAVVFLLPGSCAKPLPQKTAGLHCLLFRRRS